MRANTREPGAVTAGAASAHASMSGPLEEFVNHADEVGGGLLDGGPAGDPLERRHDAAPDATQRTDIMLSSGRR